MLQKNLNGYVSVASLAAATLGLELVQTRILSALYYNHVVYLTVTIALMGFGIAGVLVSLFINRIQTSSSTLAVCSALFAVTTLIGIYIASHLPVWWPNSAITSKLFFSYLFLILPFLFSGTAIGVLFMQNSTNIFRFYCADLIASALACAAFVMLLDPLGAPGFVCACVGLATLVFVIQARLAAFSSVTIAAFVSVIIATIIFASKSVVGLRPEPYKTLGQWSKSKGARLETTRWTPITRLDVLDMPEYGHKAITQDSDAHTLMFPANAVKNIIDSIQRREFPRGAVTLAYVMHQQPPDQSLVIGVGGGVDIITSHAYNAKQTIGVEINPVTIELVTKKYNNYLTWLNWPEVSIVNDEGRHYIRNKINQFDIITMSGIDTFSALNAGAYVLSENYLYTTEAFEDYLKALKDDGIMTINRWFEAIPPRESLRLASLHIEASQRLDLAHPEQSIFVVVQNNWASTFLKRKAFTEDEILRVMAAIKKSDMHIIYLPKIFSPERQQALEQELIRSRGDKLNIAADAYSNVIAPSSFFEKENFLKSYPLDVSPVFDDRPFFFEYHKGFSFWNLLKGGDQMRNVRMNVKNNLYILLLLCALVSISAMVVPLVIFNHQGLRTKGTPLLLIFFSCLGLGFMLVEIGIMQRLSLYLGDPMHSMLVVLSGLLLFAGGGAYLSGQFRSMPKTLFKLGTLGAMSAIFLWVVLMPGVISATQSYSFSARTLITLLSILPLGILLGIPFASGLNHLQLHSPRFIPWAWGINGLTSVLASILAIILAMKIGFNAVIIVAAFIYFIAWIAIRQHNKFVSEDT